MENDLVRLFEHPVSFRSLLASAIVILGDDGSESCEVQVEWRESQTKHSQHDKLLLSWDVDKLRDHFGEIDHEIENARERNEDRARMVEETAVIVTVAVMSCIDANLRFTKRSGAGTSHDYYLNDSRTEMIEIAGRWQGGLPTLFAEKRTQSERNSKLLKRWVSVTIFSEVGRNRTEGLHQ